MFKIFIKKSNGIDQRYSLNYFQNFKFIPFDKNEGIFYVQFFTSFVYTDTYVHK